MANNRDIDGSGTVRESCDISQEHDKKMLVALNRNPTHKSMRASLEHLEQLATA